MTTTPMYLLKILGNPTIEISQDELRSLLGQIEGELHQSKVYRRALSVSHLLGSSADQANVLFKAVGREAISLAFRQFVQQYQKVEENNEQADKNSETPAAEQTDYTDLAECLTSVQINPNNPIETTNNIDLQSESQVVTNTANNSVKTKEDSPTTKTPISWFKPNKKLILAELQAQMAAQQRLDSLREIGQQLRLARESQGLSLSQLHAYTHIQISYIEAVENGNWELLPDDVFVHGFVRVMGNALGLNGTTLAASLPAPEPVKAVLPSYYQPKNRIEFASGIRPMHLYFGYTALVAGSVGGLSMISQQANADRLINSDAVTPSSSSLTKSLDDKTPNTKPGLQSSSVGVIVGPDISPPEAL